MPGGSARWHRETRAAITRMTDPELGDALREAASFEPGDPRHAEVWEMAMEEARSRDWAFDEADREDD